MSSEARLALIDAIWFGCCVLRRFHAFLKTSGQNEFSLRLLYGVMPVRNSPLEPTADEMRSIAHRVLDLLVDTVEGLDHSPASLNTPSPELLSKVS